VDPAWPHVHRFAPDSPRGRLGYHGARVGLAAALAAFTYALFPASPAVEFPIYEMGSVAGDNVIAPFAFRVLKSESELAAEREAVARAVPPVYRFVPEALDSAKQRLAAFNGAVDQGAIAGGSTVASVQRAAASLGVSIPVDEAQYLSDPRRRQTTVTAVQRVFDRWLSSGVAPAGALDGVIGELVLRDAVGERRVPADSVATFSMLVSRARLIRPDPGSRVGDAVYLRLIGVFFHPTIVPDRVATAVEVDAVQRAIPAERYEVRAGEKIVGAHEVVGREEYDKLRALRDAVEEYRATQRGSRRVVGAVLFNMLVIAVLGIALVKFRPKLYENFRALLTFAATVALVVVGGAVVAALSPVRPELVPVALAAVLLSALFDPRISMIAAMVLAVLVGGQGVFRGTNALFMHLIGGAVAAFSVRAISRRSQAYHWIIVIAAAYASTALAIGLTLDRPQGDIFTSAGFGILNAVGSVLLALLLMPMAEAFTGVETDLTLLEWSDLNRPLMQRLSLEAPGTFAHTIAIANLADAACRAIGANALLARVGAYYHDIGKIAQPQYFVENQTRGRNPHDVLPPADSAAIIRDHVEAGLALATQHGIPRALRAFITEHHGTGSIAYFYHKARDGGGDAPPDPAKFAYPGPLPQSAETAVVMLADGVEASVRVLADPTAERIREVVNHIVRQRMEQGQLLAAPLTLRQLETIKDEFTRVLAGSYHNRIDYPAASGGVSAGFASA
jgi:putative nucleotidyltransferase with HDIG domain